MINVEQLLERNEVGDAEALLPLLDNRFIYDEEHWYMWNGGYWELSSKGEVGSLLGVVIAEYKVAMSGSIGPTRDALRRRIMALNSYHRIRSVLKIVEGMYKAPQGLVWDHCPWKLPCANGVIDLRTGKLLPGAPHYYLRTHAPTIYRAPSVIAPRWEKFLLDIMDGDQEMADFLRRLVGYVLTGTGEEHIFPVLWGRGRNGKGTFLETLGKVLGPLAAPVSSALLMESTYTRNSSSPSPDILGLRGKRLVWANETAEGKHLSTHQVKWICGGDTLTGRGLYSRKETSFQPSHTLLLLTNHRPIVDPEDYAVWQRVKLIPFSLSFVDHPTEPWERKRNTELARRFEIEDQGILAWAVRGCLEWQRYGLMAPKKMEVEAVDYQHSADTVLDFIGSELEVEEDSKLRAGRVYGKYREWCRSQGEVPVSGKKFGGRLATHYSRTRDSWGNVYQGVRFKPRFLDLFPD